MHPEVLASFSMPELGPLSALLSACGLANPSLVLLLAFLALSLCICLVPKNSGERLAGFVPGIGNSLFTAALILWCILSFAGVSTFLYFNF